MRIRFLGGADTVTGSQHMVEANGHRVLRDCGLFQGRRKEAKRINRELPFRAGKVDAMILSHAHIDHCGNIPSLAREGYQGPIHATTATAARSASGISREQSAQTAATKTPTRNTVEPSLI